MKFLKRLLAALALWVLVFLGAPTLFGFIGLVQGGPGYVATFWLTFTLLHCLVAGAVGVLAFIYAVVEFGGRLLTYAVDGEWR